MRLGQLEGEGATAELRAYSIDGDRLWTAELGRGFADQHLRAPAVVGDVVAVVDGTQLRGFDTTTGEERWRASMPEGASWPDRIVPLVHTDGERFYTMQEVGDNDLFIVAIDGRSGRELWRWSFDDWAPSALGVGFPMAASFDRGASVAFLMQDAAAASVIALDTSTGRQRWEVTVTDCPGLSGEIFSVDGVLVAHASGAQTGLSSDGATIWDSRGPDPCSGDSIERMVLDGETSTAPSTGE